MSWRRVSVVVLLLVVPVVYLATAVGSASAGPSRPLRLSEEDPTTTTTADPTTTTTTPSPEPSTSATVGECMTIGGKFSTSLMGGGDGTEYLSPEEVEALGEIHSAPGASPSDNCTVIFLGGYVGGSLLAMERLDRQRHTELVAAVEALDAGAPDPGDPLISPDGSMALGGVVAMSLGAIAGRVLV